MKNILNERLEHLLASKCFSELTAEERYFATGILSEEEYERMHILVKNAGRVLKKTPLPNPVIRENLMAAMRSGKSKNIDRPSAIVRLFRARIPAWQAAAAVAFLLGVHFLFPQKNNIYMPGETEYVYQTDTIYKEVAVAVSQPAPISNKPVLSQPKAPVHINKKPQDIFQENTDKIALGNRNPRDAYHSEIPDTFALMVSQPRGQSAKQTEDLWQFFGEVY